MPKLGKSKHVVASTLIVFLSALSGGCLLLPPVSSCDETLLPEGELVSPVGELMGKAGFGRGQPHEAQLEVKEEFVDAFLVLHRIQKIDNMNAFSDVFSASFLSTFLHEPATSSYSTSEIDFETQELIIYTVPGTPRLVPGYSPPCFLGVVDLDDGRRAVVLGINSFPTIVGFGIRNTPDGPPLTQAVIVPRSDRPVVLWRIQWPDGSPFEFDEPFFRIEAAE